MKELRLLIGLPCAWAAPASTVSEISRALDAAPADGQALMPPVRIKNIVRKQASAVHRPT